MSHQEFCFAECTKWYFLHLVVLHCERLEENEKMNE